MGTFSASDAPDLDRIAREVKNALVDLRNSVDSGAEDTKSNIQAYLANYEDHIAGPRALAAAADRQRIEMLEKAVSTGAPLDQYGEPDWSRTRYGRDTPEYKSFMHWLTQGKAAEVGRKGWKPGDFDVKVLRTNSDPGGGYLVPAVMDAQVRKNIIEVSPIRRFARTRIAYAKTLDIPRRLATVQATFEGEAEESSLDQSIYGREQVTCYRQDVTIPATLDMMVSSAFDLEREVASDVGEAMAQSEGLNFVKGSGRKGPQGILSDSRVVPYQTINSAAITWQDFAAMAGGLKRGQNLAFYMNRKTLAYIQSLTSDIHVPIWMPVAGDKPATIWGYPYSADVIDLDDVVTGAGAKPVVCADLYRGYEIYDMLGMSVTRDDLTRKKEAVTEWTFRRYLTGRVILPEAISVMSLKA